MGFDDQYGKVCLLNRSLYGLKQSARCWNEKLTTYLLETGWTKSNADLCLFFRCKPEMFLVVYIDEGLMLYHLESDVFCQSNEE